MKQPEDSHGLPKGKGPEESCCSPSSFMGKVMKRLTNRFCGKGKEELPPCCSMTEEMTGEMDSKICAETSKQGKHANGRDRK